MNIVGFNFTKISAERKRAMAGTVNINNNISLTDITEAKIGIGQGERSAVRVSFSFKSEYTPEMALIALQGELLLLIESKRAAEILKNWKDKHQLPKDVAQVVMNHVLERCNIQALLFAKDLNLPSPVPLPKVSIGAPAQMKAQPKASAKDAPKEKKKK
jgi:hypothetical protein